MPTRQLPACTSSRSPSPLFAWPSWGSQNHDKNDNKHIPDSFCSAIILLFSFAKTIRPLRLLSRYFPDHLSCPPTDRNLQPHRPIVKMPPPADLTRAQKIKYAFSSPSNFHNAVVLDDSSRLQNEDLVPSPPHRRKWGIWSYFSLWFSESWNVSTW